MNKTKNKTFFITTPLYYPSGNLHLGHLYTTSLAWVIKNFKKMNGFDTLFLTGSDEHGLKIQQKAQEMNMKEIDYANIQVDKFKKMWEISHIDYDIFARTTDIKHEEIIKKIIVKLYEKKYIYKDYYKGLYSIQDEEFLTESQAVKLDGKFYHPTSNHELVLVKEESYFLKLTIFKDWLIEYINNNPNFIIPQKTINEIKNSFLNESFEDLSISRTSFDWGINFDFDSKHVVYVWIDALFSYLTPLNLFRDNEDLFNKFWTNGTEKVHLVGKEISRFHCIYWPIMLKMLNLELPTKIISHSWIITSKGKMSKSKGNIIDPLTLFDLYHYEVIKLFLVTAFNIERDNTFEIEHIKIFYNINLVNNYSNLLSRVSAMIEQNHPEKLFLHIEELNEKDQNILNKIEELTKDFTDNFNEFKINKSFEITFNLGHILNSYIDETQLWLLKEEKIKQQNILIILLNGIYAMSVMLNSSMPDLMQIAKEELKQDSLSFANINNWNKFNNKKIIKAKTIFERIK